MFDENGDENVRVGIITVHNGQNYGASLQAYALVQMLRKLGHDTYLIDYRTKKIEDKMNSYKMRGAWNSMKGIKKNIRLILSNILFSTNSHSNQVAESFGKFHNDIFCPCNKTYFNFKQLYELNNDYDAFICGSDQIWNPKITALDKAFFLTFANKDKITVAYAPSLGMDSECVDTEFRQELNEKLKSVKHLSIREENNRKLIEELTNRNCTTTVDPVLLLDRSEWMKILIDHEIINPRGKFAFYYPVIEQPEMENFAKKECKKRGWNLINPRLVPSYAKIKGYTCFSKDPVGPKEFLSLLADAEAVFTNSFHATVFSSVFKKELFIIPLKGEYSSRNNRIFEYLKMLNILEKSFNDKSTSLIHLSGGEFEKADKILEFERIKAIDYLNKALKL